MTNFNFATFGVLIPILLSCFHKIKSNSSTPRRREKTLEALGSKLKNFSHPTFRCPGGFATSASSGSDKTSMRCFHFQTFLCSCQGSSLNISEHLPLLLKAFRLSPASFQPGLSPGNETRLESCSLHGSRHVSVSHTKSFIDPCVSEGSVGWRLADSNR